MNMLKRTATVALVLAVGVLTMPLWPLVFAVMVWNDYADEDATFGGEETTNGRS